MTSYDEARYQPPAPVAYLTLRTTDGRELSLAQVPALLDTGADVTLLPKWAIEQLGLVPQADDSVMLAWFDGSVRAAESVELEATFHGGRFRGRFALIDQPHGIVGRNLLNHFRMCFDGPAKTWWRLPGS